MVYHCVMSTYYLLNVQVLSTSVCSPVPKYNWLFDALTSDNLFSILMALTLFYKINATKQHFLLSNLLRTKKNKEGVFKMGLIKVLVKKAKKGDGEAFVALVKQYEDVLYRTARRMLNNDEDAADAMQDAIVSAYENLHTLRKDEYFNTWLYKILLNKCNRLLNKKQNFVTLDVYLLPEQRNGDFEHIELEEALNSLSEDYKTAFTLYYIVGMTTKEISAFLKEPEGTVKSRLSRGKSLLRDRYYKYEGAIANEN